MMLIENKNVLILSAGRRVELVKAFKEAIDDLDVKGKVFAADSSPEFAAACYVADEYVKLPKVTDDQYVERLKHICLIHSIRLVIPTIDLELEVLSKARASFQEMNIFVSISDMNLIEKCRDKRLTSSLFTDIGINTPSIYHKSMDTIRFPCFVKPYDGSRSVGAFKCDSKDYLTLEILSNPKLIIMECVEDSHQEYTIDAYYDRDGILKCFVPRERIEVRDGEVSKSRTVKSALYSKLRPIFERLKDARGCITIQVFADTEYSSLYAIEINPRFGGGYPLSYASGAKYTHMLVKEYIIGENIEYYEEWEEGLLMLRYDAMILK